MTRLLIAIAALLIAAAPAEARHFGDGHVMHRLGHGLHRLGHGLHRLGHRMRQHHHRRG